MPFLLRWFQDYIFAVQKTGKMLVFSISRKTRLGEVGLDNNATPQKSFGVTVFAADKQVPMESTY